MVWVISFQSPPLKPLTIRVGMSIERSISARALAKYSQWPSLRLTRKSSTGSSLRVDRLHAERIAELVGIAQEDLQGAGPGLGPRGPSSLMEATTGSAILRSWALSDSEMDEQPLVVGQVGRLLAGLEAGGIGVGEHLIVIGADALDRAAGACR